MTRLLFVSCMILSLLTLAPRVSAQETGYAVFVTPKGAADGDSAGLLQKLLRQQLRTYAGVTVVEHTGSEPKPPATLLSAIEAGFRALNDAVTSKDAAAADKPGAPALVEFDEAYAELQRLQTSGAFIPRRAAARLFKGFAVAHTLNKAGKTAQPFVHDSLNLWPQQTAQEYAWSMAASNMVSFVTKLREDNTDVGSIKIGAPAASDTVAGAQVRVDGKIAGRVPVTAVRMRPGQHLVDIRRDGYAPKSALTTVFKDQVATVRADLKPLDNAARVAELVRLIGKQRKDAKAKPMLDELAGAVQTQRVIVLRVSQKKNTWKLSGFTGGEGDTKTHATTVARDAKMVTSLQALLTEATGMSPGGTPAGNAAASLGGPPKQSLILVDGKAPAGKDAIGEGVEDTEVYETWWFWTAIGGGVAVITVAAVLAVVLTQEDDAPKPGAIDIQMNRL